MIYCLAIIDMCVQGFTCYCNFEYTLALTLFVFLEFLQHLFGLYSEQVQQVCVKQVFAFLLKVNDFVV